ncbi:hypothetical protein SJAG_03969 [Schizosaccharomyces japonicus yFS275]|uniref:Uncharacterized protein n=1 Tax=Schizosaccharomyces japonicus (strain yFS275 / FY16936) TaxID=402676 RepID=B6K5J6_SCHJY|nr:hypothetical protein SJAG_03969 [Schizosaccharomyces japonicus yFS275]EEB08800.1 hypothetical protein SJAG_03969 [Schizosaccharomyces japonicus yFS275]
MSWNTSISSSISTDDNGGVVTILLTSTIYGSNTVTISAPYSNSTSGTNVFPMATFTGTSSTSASSSSAGSNKSGGGGVSTGGVVAMAVAIPVGCVIILSVLGWYLWRRYKHARELKAARKQEVEEYGFNPNQHSGNFRGPTRNPSTAGYRGWNGNAGTTPATTVAATGAGAATTAAVPAANGAARPIAPRAPLVGAGALSPNAAARLSTASSLDFGEGNVVGEAAAAAGAAAAAPGSRLVRPIGNPPNLTPPTSNSNNVLETVAEDEAALAADALASEYEHSRPSSIGSSSTSSNSPFSSDAAPFVANVHDSMGSNMSTDGALATIPEVDADSESSFDPEVDDPTRSATRNSFNTMNTSGPNGSSAASRPRYDMF